MSHSVFAQFVWGLNKQTARLQDVLFAPPLAATYTGIVTPSRRHGIRPDDPRPRWYRGPFRGKRITRATPRGSFFFRAGVFGINLYSIISNIYIRHIYVIHQKPGSVYKSHSRVTPSNKILFLFFFSNRHKCVRPSAVSWYNCQIGIYWCVVISWTQIGRRLPGATSPDTIGNSSHGEIPVFFFVHPKLLSYIF